MPTIALAVPNESLILISDSLAHNSEIRACVTCVFYIDSQITVLYSLQYKCKDAFAHLSRLEESYGIQTIYHYTNTESGNGKGPSHGLGAAIKMRLQRMILGGRVINNAYQAYFKHLFKHKMH